MKLEHLTNKSATNLYNELSAKLMSTDEFSIGSAFINDEAISLIESALKKNKKLNGRILIGLYNFFNKKKDLEKLLQLTYQYPNKIQVNISLSQNFHWKFYHFIYGSKQTFYVGSANFTVGGMKDNREIVVKISGSKYKPESSITSLSNSFNKEWDNSSSLGSFPIEHYEEYRPENELKGKLHLSIQNFFNQKIEQKYDVVTSDKTFAVYARHDIKESTRKAIRNQKPQWFENKWDYFVLSSNTHYKQCLKTTKLLIFSWQSKKNITAFITERKDDCNSIHTEDGKYFIAYKIVKEKKLNEEQIQKFKSKPFFIDLTGWKKPLTAKTLGKVHMQKIKEFLKIE